MAQQINNFWTMRVTNQDRAQIEALARREGTSASAAVRAAVQKALKDHDQRRPDQQAGVSVSP